MEIKTNKYYVSSDWKSYHELSTEVLIVRGNERATKRWLISDEIRWLKGKQTTSGIYFRFSKVEVVFRRQNLRPNRLGKGLLSVRRVHPLMGRRMQGGMKNISLCLRNDAR